MPYSIIDSYNTEISVMSRVTNSTLPQQPKRIYCAYHPTEFLTNFCCDSECLMPLCPNCIVEHTEQHFLQSNKPCYVNLFEAMGETKQKCYQHIVILQQLSRANDRIMDYIMGLRESIHNQLMEDKQEIYKEIDKLFESYEEKLYAETLEKYRALEVYDRKETSNISEFITEQIETLHEQIAVLKSDNCLAGLITYFANDGKIYEESIKELSEHINKHKKAGRISINNDDGKISKSLEGFCEKNIVVEFINEEGREDESIEKEQSSRKCLNSHVGKRGCYEGKENVNCIKKSEQFYRIDASDLKSSKQLSRTSMLRPQYAIRHY